jgi:outer membrane murein-binding lipoprotein Lpp
MKALLLFRRKAFLLAATAILFVPQVLQAASLRYVNGKEVDLQPLIDWAADKKGERPLKHWKLVQIVENKGQSAFQIVVANIEGAKTEIALKNCPAEILGLLAQKKDLEARLAAVKQDHQAAAQEAAGAHKRRDVKQQAKRTEASDVEEEKSIKKELAEVEEKIKKQKGVFAMATGSTYNGVPVWDTGLRGP